MLDEGGWEWVKLFLLLNWLGVGKFLKIGIWGFKSFKCYRVVWFSYDYGIFSLDCVEFVFNVVSRSL